MSVNQASTVTANLFFPFRPQTGLYLTWAILVAAMILVAEAVPGSSGIFLSGLKVDRT
jgi:hypothetical protein